MWVEPEERPTCVTGVDRAFQPRHGLVGVTEYCIHASDLAVGVMGVAEGTRRVECPPNTLERRGVHRSLPVVPVAMLPLLLPRARSRRSRGRKPRGSRSGSLDSTAGPAREPCAPLEVVRCADKSRRFDCAP